MTDDEVVRLRRQLRAMAAHNEHLRAQLEAATAELARRGTGRSAPARRVADLQGVVVRRARQSPEVRRLGRKWKRMVQRHGGPRGAVIEVTRTAPGALARRARRKLGG